MSLPPIYVRRTCKIGRSEIARKGLKASGTLLPKRRPAQYLLSLVLGTMILGANAVGGPPLLTDDPDTPGPNHWEINVALTSEKNADAWRFETPLIDLNYGIGEHLELTYEVPLVVLDAENEATRGGIGNSLVGVKWRFLDQEKAWLDGSTYPQFEFNHGNSSVDRGLAEAGWSLLVPFELGHKFGPLTVYSESGFYLKPRRPNEWLYGIAAEYQISEKFSIMGEFHGGCNYRFRDDQLISNFGSRWQFHKNISLLASVGRDLRPNIPGDSGFLSYLALQFTF